MINNKLIKTPILSISIVTSLYSSTGTLKQTANLRELPSLTSQKIIILYKNEKVNVFKKVYTKNDGTWYKTNKGFISSELLGFKDLDYRKIKNSYTRYKITATALMIRKYPLLHTQIMGKYKKNTIIQALAFHKDEDNKLWIETKDGFVYAQYLEEIAFQDKIEKEIIEKQIVEQIVEQTEEAIVIEKQIIEPKIEIEPVKKENINVPVIKVTHNPDTSEKYFIGVSAGYSQMKVIQNDKVGSLSLGTQPDEKGLNLNLELGYKYNSNYFSTVSYSLIKYNDIKLHNYLASYNKVFNDIRYKPYLGIVGGISYIELTKSHINSQLTDKTGQRFAIGFQTGFEKELYKSFNFFTQYQYIKAKHLTSLESSNAKSELIRDNYSNLSFGIRWGF
ncbi:MAG: hypothetical protein KAQ94_00570 [Arcobacteraceae bacterium]|nr:hypothetical protein [Arcobacteraceae bacterium]